MSSSLIKCLLFLFAVTPAFAEDGGEFSASGKTFFWNAQSGSSNSDYRTSFSFSRPAGETLWTGHATVFKDDGAKLFELNNLGGNIQISDDSYDLSAYGLGTLRVKSGWLSTQLTVDSHAYAFGCYALSVHYGDSYGYDAIGAQLVNDETYEAPASMTWMTYDYFGSYDIVIDP